MSPMTFFLCWKLSPSLVPFPDLESQPDAVYASLQGGASLALPPNTDYILRGCHLENEAETVVANLVAYVLYPTWGRPG